MKIGRSIILALAAIALTIGVLWFSNGTVAPKEAPPEDVMAEARQGSYRLINTDELWARYKANPDTVLLVDTRQEWEYRTGHIKGAMNFPMEPTWLSRWRKKNPLKTFLGSDKNRLIIFY